MCPQFVDSGSSHRTKIIGFSIIAATAMSAQTLSMMSNVKAAQSSKAGSVKREMDARNDEVRQSYTKVLDDAMKAAGKHHDLGSQEFKVTIRPTKDGWSVWIVFLPETPGADLMVKVRREGGVDVVGGF